MSRRFQKVLNNLFPVSFLETIEPDADGMYTLVIDVLTDDPSEYNGSMRVRVNHEGEHTDCDILLNDKGEGTFTLDGMQARVITLMQIDDSGNQVVNDHHRFIRYYVDKEEQDGIASICNDECAGTHHVNILHERLKKAVLHLTKKIATQCEEHLPDDDDSFDISIHGQGIAEIITLDACNQYHKVIELPCGVYTISEINDLSDVNYRFNHQLTKDCLFELDDGEYHLDIINQKNANTSLMLESVMRSSTGEIMTPDCNERFMLHVISDQRQMEIILDQTNDFCVQLKGLCPGYYSIEEASGDYAVSFMVNGECEKSYAHLEVMEDCDNHVVVINDMDDCDQAQTSQLQICKYIRTKDGCLVKPKQGQNFQVTIEGCGLCQTMNLNEDNNFCVDIASLCSGCYRIYEMDCKDYLTSYSINNEMEKTTANLFVRDNQSYCVTVINAEKHAGSLHVTKYIRNDYGDLVKPQRHECFDVMLSSYFCKECFTLRAENDWSLCFDNLRQGSYEIKECQCDDYYVEYQVDGKRPTCDARFIMDGCDREVRVINIPYRQMCGTLKICKFEETESCELVKPQRDECFHVCVEGTCFKETYTLKASNHWCVLLDGLEPGEYRIHELEEEEFAASYVVNGERCEMACVEMGCENQEVNILNHRRRNGTLEISAELINCDGEQQQPYEGVSIDVLIEGKENCFHVCLSRENDWRVMLDDLPQDTYRIIQKDNLGFAVSYDVDGCEQDFARIAMNNDDHQIRIINAFTNCAGIVKVTKYIEDEDGNFIMPCADEEFTFELKGRDFCNTYTLCGQNDFCVYFDDLNEGCYEIKELECDFDVRYLINKQPYHEARFTLGIEDIYVDIINKDRLQDSVIVEKRIREDGQLCIPNDDECFKIALSGRNTYELFELNKQNNYCVVLEGLSKQHYELKELCSSAKTYVIDGCEQEDGYFLFEGNTKHITIINEEEKTGALRLEKLIEDDCGNLVRPQRWESFDVLIESENFKRKVTLDASNNFCICLYDIPCGHYEIQELCPQGAVTYLIHDMPCEKAIVDIVEEDVSVTIINSSLPYGSIHFQGLIEKDGIVMQADPLDEFVISLVGDDETHNIVLHAGNDYCVSMENLRPGHYMVTEAGKEDIVFAIEDQRFDDNVCIELNGECVEVNVIKMKKRQSSITVTKWMLDAKGSKCYPNKDDSFIITLLHHGKKQMFELNSENGFTKVLCDQQPGSYEVKEEQQYASFQINDGAIQTEGKFELKDASVRVNVLNKSKQMSVLRLSALIQTCDDVLMTPGQDDCYEITLHGEDMQKKITLSAQNSWKTRLEMPCGAYDLMINEEHYFIIDHQRQEQNRIQVTGTNIMVQAVMTKASCRGSILLQKYIRSADCDCFRKPMMDESYDIEIIGDHFQRMVQLNHMNHYQELIEELPRGKYTVQELGGNQVVYIVNGGMECYKAVVDVDQNSNQVKIIKEALNESKGSIEICKLLKDEEGCYRYPDANDNYWIQIKGEEGTTRVLLNEANHFYASIRNLKDGWYEVMEENQENQVWYVVNNGAPMKKGVVHVVNNANTVNVVNAIKPLQGDIKICKWVRMGSELEKPRGGEYRIYVSKPGYQNLIVLNEANQYCMTITGLEAGTYVINEVDGNQVTYIIDGGSELNHAIVDVNNSSHTIDVINQETGTQGSISFTKYRRINGQMVRPENNMSYEFYLSAPGYQNDFVLNRSNNWQLVLDQLANGDYVLTELNAVDKVTYMIDAGSEVDRAIITVNNDTHNVTIINTPQQQMGGSIHVEKFIRVNQQLVKPDNDASFQLHVSKPGYNKVFTLDQSNQFMVDITDLEDGFYVLDELNQSENVSYIINQGSETTNGIVEVRGNSNQVQMINSQAISGGSIAFRKYIKNANGSLTIPAAGDEYTLEVYNANVLLRVYLNTGNNFQSTLSNLAQGTYFIRELDAGNFRVTYRINGGAETSEGSVNVQNGVQTTVDVLNERRENINTVEVFKYLLDRDGNYLPPEAPNTYNFKITGYQVNRLYQLEVANDWHVTITDLPSGTYQIQETTQDPSSIRYLVNSAELKEQAVFTAIPDRTNVIGIINLLPGVEDGQMTITKRIRNAQGELIIPENVESFVVQVTGTNFDRLVSLDRTNNFTATLTNLAYGNYLINERDANYIVTFQVNGGEENTLGSVNITSGDANEVVVINSNPPTSSAAPSATSSVTPPVTPSVTPSAAPSIASLLTPSASTPVSSINHDDTVKIIIE